MSNLFLPPEGDAEEVSLKDGVSTWDEVRRVADELELKIHLASMNARDRWRAIEPRVATIERALVESGRRVTRALAHEIDTIRTLLRELREDVENGNYPRAGSWTRNTHRRSSVDPFDTAVYRPEPALVGFAVVRHVGNCSHRAQRF
jgi:hypothetical protein